MLFCFYFASCGENIRSDEQNTNGSTEEIAPDFTAFLNREPSVDKDRYHGDVPMEVIHGKNDDNHYYHLEVTVFRNYDHLGNYSI